MTRMTPVEAFVETLVAQGVKDVFGIVGSAYMDALDLFPAAGIRFIPIAHEQGAGHMADGYSPRLRPAWRVHRPERPRHHQLRHRRSRPPTGRTRRSWSSRPRPAPARMGLGGFQETEQLPIFSKITKYQVHVQQARAHGRAHRRAASTWRMAERGPTQLNIPRDYFYGEVDCDDPASRKGSRAGPAPTRAWTRPPSCLARPRFPVIVSGGGVIMSGGVEEAVALAEYLPAPVVNTYLHNDSFPADHPLWCGPLGYQGSKAAMKLIAQADVVLALGTRLGPFGTLPQHGLDYWPKNAKIIQVDSDHRMLGLVKQISVGVVRRCQGGGARADPPARQPRRGRRAEPAHGPR